MSIKITYGAKITGQIQSFEQGTYEAVCEVEEGDIPIIGDQDDTDNIVKQLRIFAKKQVNALLEPDLTRLDSISDKRDNIAARIFEYNSEQRTAKQRKR